MKNKKEKTLYTIDLGESVAVGDYRVTRVPGGWIFRNSMFTVNGLGEKTGSLYPTDTFVRYHNEFTIKGWIRKQNCVHVLSLGELEERYKKETGRRARHEHYYPYYLQFHTKEFVEWILDKKREVHSHG